MPIAEDFIFFGRLSLDFAHTGDMGYGPRFERLKSPGDLNRWLSLSPLRLPPLPISDFEMEEAKMLRRAIWRVASALVAGTAAGERDVQRINRAARQPALVVQLARDRKSMRWHSPTLSAVLATLAADAIQLFGDATQRTRIRRCENSGCQAIFYDDSRPGLRRWCAPNRCGDRMRAKVYRQRKSQGHL